MCCLSVRLQVAVVLLRAGCVFWIGMVYDCAARLLSCAVVGFCASPPGGCLSLRYVWVLMVRGQAACGAGVIFGVCSPRVFLSGVATCPLVFSACEARASRVLLVTVIGAAG